MGHSLSPIEAPRGDSRCCKGVERCRRRCWVDGSWPSSKFDAQAIYQASTKPLVEQGWMARLADISGPQQVCQCHQTSPGVPEAPHRDGFVYLGRSGCHRPISVAAPVPSGQRSSNVPILASSCSHSLALHVCRFEPSSTTSVSAQRNSSSTSSQRHIERPSWSPGPLKVPWTGSIRIVARWTPPVPLRRRRTMLRETQVRMPSHLEPQQSRLSMLCSERQTNAPARSVWLPIQGVETEQSVCQSLDSLQTPVATTGAAAADFELHAASRLQEHCTALSKSRIHDPQEAGR